MTSLATKLLTIVALLAMLGSPAGHAQDVAAPTQDDPSATVAAGQRRLRTIGIIGVGTALVAAYGRNNWWQDGFDGEFKTVDEGWFGQETYTGGADKLGHGYFAYLGGRLLARAFEWAGNTPESSRSLGAWTSLATLTAVEVLDGYARRWRFSREDALMNVAGAGLAYVMERHPGLDRLIDLRLQYKPSRDARRLNQFDPVGDHSGQTYLLAAKASGVPRLAQHRWLRYLELTIGYGSRGYEPPGSDERSRHIYFGISLNLSEVLRQTAYRGDPLPGRSQRITETVFEFLQVPGTAALSDHRLGR